MTNHSSRAKSNSGVVVTGQRNFPETFRQLNLLFEGLKRGNIHGSRHFVQRVYVLHNGNNLSGHAMIGRPSF